MLNQPSPDSITEAITRAAAHLQSAEALLITAGSGINVDSGLPDFRGTEGFWKLYPPYQALGMDFQAVANPLTLKSDPHLFWGYFGQRLNLYRTARPHDGFAILHRWAEARPAGGFVFTSNVDGQFQKAGFESKRVLECHGSNLFLQCSDKCSSDIWAADGVAVAVDEQTMRAADPLPVCPKCGKLARPNILMFVDGKWNPNRTSGQERHYQAWLKQIASPEPLRLAVIEIGSGSAIPTVQKEGTSVAARLGAPFIRINPREFSVPPGGIGIPLPALEALRRIDAQMPASA
jgi:NAD-dependent SIR2 family protein deacetylase